MTGEFLTAWTIRLSLLAYTGALVGFLALEGRGHRFVLRWAWTAGCLLLAVHVICAFQYYHDWSHRQAFQQTAADTESLMGWSFGGGIYFNYALVVVWCVDVAWWWLAATSYERRHWSITFFVQAFLFFMAFNGSVVFAEGPTRWAGIAITVLLVTLLFRQFALKGTAHTRPASP